MEILKTFDPYALIAPRGPDAVLALLREFNAEIQELQATLDAITAQCEAEKATA